MEGISMRWILALLVTYSLTFWPDVLLRESQGEKPQADRPQQVLVLNTRSLPTMQRELDHAAALGYRIDSAVARELEVGVGESESRRESKADGRSETYSETVHTTEISVPLDEIEVRLIKVTEQDRTFQYKLVAAIRAATMEKELNQFATQGFRLIPEIMVQKRPVIGSPELVIFMEKSPGSAGHYKYLILATDRESTLRKEIDQALKDGYALRGIRLFRQRLAFMEKEGES